MKTTIFIVRMFSYEDNKALFPIVEHDIALFLGYYWSTFPQATVLLKMHILEDHTVPWMRQWHLASGLMGEQGAESMHALTIGSRPSSVES